MGTPPTPIPPSLPAGYDPSTGVLPPENMVQVGNIDVNHRPIVWNDDGTPSTIFSATIPTEGGKWALVPTIADGRFLTPDGKIPKEDDKKAMSDLEDRAADHFKKTGEHLGIFKSQKAADDYADATHAFMPNGRAEKVFVPHYEGESNMPLTRKEYEAELARRNPPIKNSHVDFSDLGGKLIHSASPTIQKIAKAITAENPQYEEAELHRIATMPDEDFNKWYASESDPVLRTVGAVANAVARVVPGEAQASEAQTAAQKTKAGKQVGDFVRGQLEHPEQVAMASADAGLPSDFIESLGGHTVRSVAEPLPQNDYVYHAADKSRADSITKNGLRPKSWYANTPQDALRSGVAPVSGNRADLRVFAVPRAEISPVEADKADIGAREIEKGRFVMSGKAHQPTHVVDAEGRPIRTLEKK